MKHIKFVEKMRTQQKHRNWNSEENDMPKRDKSINMKLTSYYYYETDHWHSV